MVTAKFNLAPDILAVWQPVGHSTYKITEALARKFGKKATHTGVLDPLAEGVILVLFGDERFSKMEHSDGLKEYEFEITFGLATDSYDGLGKITHTDFEKHVTEAQLISVFKSLIGPYTQKVPVYSAQKVGGKKLFMYPKLNKPLPKIPEKSGRIISLELLEFSTGKIHSKIDTILSKIAEVTHGEFRQKEISNLWLDYLATKADHDVELAKVRVILTRGMYVRSLATDICKLVNKHGFVSDLKRTKNGLYTQKNCLDLTTLFGSDPKSVIYAKLDEYGTKFNNKKTQNNI